MAEEEKKICVHEFKIADTVFTSKNNGYHNYLYTRITRYYCIHCLYEVEKIRQESCEFKPDWYLVI